MTNFKYDFLKKRYSMSFLGKGKRFFGKQFFVGNSGRLLLSIFFLPALLVLASCQPFGPRVQGGLSSDSGLLENGATNQLDLVNDIPVPEGSVLDTQLSLVLGRGDRWTGRLVLRLNLPPAQSASIYQNEMPAFGWQPLFNIQEGFGLYTYLRGDRIANVRIDPLGIRGSRISVTVALREPDNQAGDRFNVAPDSRSNVTPGIIR